MRLLMGHSVRFFEPGPRDKKQLGFTIMLDNGSRLVYSGSGLLPESCFQYAEGADWLLHEAYCLHSQKDIYNPYEKGHCTVRDACETAAHLEIPNLILWQTEDDNIARRSELYSAEAKLYYKGRVHVPYDLESLELS